MTYTQEQALDDVRSRLDEVVPRYWSNEELRRWINEACRDIARRAEILQTTGTIAVTADDNEYTCPTDVARIYRVTWKQTGDTTEYPLEYHDFNDMDAAGWSWTNASGWPAVYTLWGYPPSLTITLYPVPTVAGTLTLWYYKYPTDLALDGSESSSTVDVPQGWESLIALYCEMLAKRKDADQTWTEAKGLYEEQLAELMARTRRWTDQSGSIQHAGTWLPGWLYSGDW